MSVDPVQNLINELKDLKRRLKTLETAPSQQNMTIDKGKTRVLAEEGLEIGAPDDPTGSEIVYGTLTIFGKIDGDGTFEWSGGWRFDSGDGEIAGNVALTGNFNLTGVFTSGNVRIEDGRIYVGVGGNQIVIDGTTGEIIVGAMRIDPSASGGAVVFDTGAELRSENGLTWLVHGNNGVAVDGDQVIVRYGARQLRIAADGIKLAGLPARAGTGLPVDAVGADADGTLWRAA